jgi:formate hydrogenlyase subunit 4
MEILYTFAALILLPLVGAALHWLRTREQTPQANLQQALAALIAPSPPADYLLGLLGWLGPGLALGGLLGGADVISVALLLELGAVAAAMSGLLDSRTWAQLAGARRLQFALFHNLSYFIALVTLIALAGRLDLPSIAVWPGGALRLVTHGLALFVILVALPAKLEAHPFEVSADAEAISKLNPLASAMGVGRLAHEAGLLIFVAELLLPSPGSQIGQIVLVAVITLLLTLVVRFFSQSISARLRPDQAYDFYWLYGLALAVTLIVGTVVAG